MSIPHPAGLDRVFVLIKACNKLFNRLPCKLGGLSIAIASASPLAGAASLSEVYQLALANDPVIASAEATYGAGKTLKAQALATLLPSIDGSYRWTKNSSSVLSNMPTGAFNSESYTVSLSQNIFNLQALFGYKQALSSVEQSALTYASAQQELIVRTASAYFDVLRGEDNLASAKAEERAIARQLEQTQQRYEVGLIAITDVHEAQAAYDLVIANRLSLEADLGIANESLAQITGEYIENLDLLAADFTASRPSPDNVQDWVNHAEQNNLQLKLAEQVLNAAAQNAHVKTSAFAPTVSGFAEYSKNRNTFIPGIGNEDDVFGVQAQWSLFNGGGKWAERKQAGYQRVAAQADLVGAKRNVIQQTRSAFLRTATGAARVNARQRAIISSTSALDATQAGYDAGTRNIVDLLNAQRDLYAAQRDYANARYDYVINSLRLKQAAGTINANDLSSISLESRQ